MRLGVLALCVAVVSCTACFAKPVGVKAPGVRTVVEEYDSSVEVSVFCLEGEKQGSGVLFGADQALTAAHVVRCATSELPLLIVLVKRDGTQTIATVAELDAGADLARLDALGLESAQIRVGPVPIAGQDVCIVSAVPRRMRRCGEVQLGVQTAPGDYLHDAVTEPGNSGSGVYDRAGRLVGIVTHLLLCPSNGQICGGKIASLSLHPEVLE